MAVLAAVVAVFRPWRRAAPPSSHAVLAVPAEIARLGPDSAYARGLRLITARRYTECLPYLRYALSIPGAPMEAHLNFSNGLEGASIEGRERRGLPGLAARSSLERIALMREALAQVDLAERQARTPSEQAYVHATFAHHYVTWGMPWEALVEFRKAQLADPSSSWEVIADILAARLHHPERPDPGTGPEAPGP